jgi:7,8-dihydropterin-6-yl-methyl-4-(beta-D-ribofuranosyl)aminobenzene 5'-phosphate synthase
MEDQSGIDRRAFMTMAAATLAAAYGGTAFSAQPMIGVTSVDELTLQVVVDAATFGPFLADQRLPGLRVERTGGRPAARMPRRSLMAEFGLSLLAVSRRGSETRHVMVDFGYSPEVLANNISLLGIDPRRLDAAVLSHGHLDHYGGFAGLFTGFDRQDRALPLYVGGEETFCERVAMIGTPPPVMGTLDRAELARAGLQSNIVPRPILVAGHGFTTGVIPLQGFERAAIPTQMRPGVGCALPGLSPGKRNRTQLPDDGEHELATCYAVKGLGLVVIASCSHRGVLNSVRRAQAVSGIGKVHAVIGGFHLVRPRTEDEARRTVAEFAAIDPTYIIPMHCTGEVFIAEALRRMPQKVIRPYVGNRLVFGSA